MPTVSNGPHPTRRKSMKNVDVKRNRERFDGEYGYEQPVDEDEAPSLLLIIWPLLAGLVGSVTSSAILDWLSNKPAWMTTLVFPFMVLARRREFGLSDEMLRTLPQIMLAIQFPVEGLYAMVAMRRRHSMGAIAAEIIFIHLVAAFVLWLLNQQSGAPLG